MSPGSRRGASDRARAWGDHRRGTRRASADAGRVAARASAAEVSRRAGLDGLIWVTTDGGSAALWMFDADTGENSVRTIPATRDPATAAALALTAKAMLQRTVVAPTTPRGSR